MNLITLWEVAHVALLYVPPLVAVSCSVSTWIRWNDTVTAGRELIRTAWPFLLIGVLESWTLNIDGRLIAEWLVPGMVSLFITAASRDIGVIRRCRRWLIVLAIVLIISGGGLMSCGHPTLANYRSHGKHAEWSWMTPANGMRRMVPDPH